MEIRVEYWIELQKIQPKNYLCGYCSHNVASKEGYIRTNINTYDSNDLQDIPTFGAIYICPLCSRPTYFDHGFLKMQIPGPIYGDEIVSISNENIAAMYDEARKCMTLGANTAAVMCCRKILMQIAVVKGAKSGMSFLDYVNFILDSHLAPGGSNMWIDSIREIGNEANHEVNLMQRRDAEDLIDFISLLLKSLYEYPARIAERKNSV